MEESYSKLEYQVTIYRLADEKIHKEGHQYLPNGSGIIINPLTANNPATNSYIVPLNEPVFIGTRLQLRASINPESGKLQWISISVFIHVMNS